MRCPSLARCPPLALAPDLPVATPTVRSAAAVSPTCVQTASAAAWPAAASDARSHSPATAAAARSCNSARGVPPRARVTNPHPEYLDHEGSPAAAGPAPPRRPENAPGVFQPAPGVTNPHPEYLDQEGSRAAQPCREYAMISASVDYKIIDVIHSAPTLTSAGSTYAPVVASRYPPAASITALASTPPCHCCLAATQSAPALNASRIDKAHRHRTTKP